MSFELPPLPYALDALEPHISRETLEYHYGKHHRTYVDNLNKLVEGTPMARQSLLEVVRGASGPVFNNAGQAWNHTFYFESLGPKGGGDPSGELERALASAFGSVAAFREKFSEKAVSLFGSGWAWLVLRRDGGLEIVQTSNADTPARSDESVPLLTCDVWEHAYYIDYRNARAKYVASFWNTVDWTTVSKRFQAKR
jgi:Fe-Mn family superoxide dismutase